MIFETERLILRPFTESDAADAYEYLLEPMVPMLIVLCPSFVGETGAYQATAVGTSTFIMTFTALIAAVSNIMIHPAIVFEKWDVMLLCIVVATAASLISARFANRVKNRTIGLATGAVFGAAMIVLNYFVA